MPVLNIRIVVRRLNNQIIYRLPAEIAPGLFHHIAGVELRHYDLDWFHLGENAAAIFWDVLHQALQEVDEQLEAIEDAHFVNLVAEARAFAEQHAEPDQPDWISSDDEDETGDDDQGVEPGGPQLGAAAA